MRPIVKTEMFTNQSKTNLDEKILFSKITHHLDHEIRKMLAKGFRIPFWFMIYLLPKLKFCF